MTRKRKKGQCTQQGPLPQKNKTNEDLIAEDVAEQRRLGYASYGQYRAAQEAGALRDQHGRKK